MAVASRLPAQLGAPLAQAAKGADISGMTEVMIVSAVMLVLAGIAIAIFLPTRITPIEESE